MNVQKIFEALEQDSQNSALGIICGELEAQGYEVSINGRKVRSEGFFEGEYIELEENLNDLIFSLSKLGNIEQRFAVVFTEYHEIAIKPVPSNQ